MTHQEAKRVLLLYRPGVDPVDPGVSEALEMAHREQELGEWLKANQAFNQAVSTRLKEIQPSQALKARILAEAKTIRLQVTWWRSPTAIAAAAAAVVVGLAVLTGVVLRGPRPDQFSQFEGRMVSTALREYRMDIETDKLPEVRQFMSERGAPADFEVPRGLGKLELAGGGLLRWQNKPVAMVCFRRTDDQMLYLFVMSRAAVNNPPPENPEVHPVRELSTASWSKGDKAYVLAGPEETDFARKYL